MNAGDHHRSTSTDIKSLPDQISPSASPRPAEFQWRVRGRTIRITRPYVVGILNITPNSFRDGAFSLALLGQFTVQGAGNRSHRIGYPEACLSP